MIETIRQKIKDELANARNPVLLCSFSKDSLLLLYLLREVCPEIPVIFLHSDLMPEQWEFAERVIRQLNLTVHNWPPSDAYIVPRGEGVSMVSEYSFGTATLPTVSDFEHGSRCVMDADSKRLPVFDYDFDVSFIGSKKTDSHFITGDNPLPEDIQFGPTRLVAPLRDLTDSDVWNLIVELGIPFDEIRYLGDDSRDPSTKHFCTRCLEGGTVFCPKANKKIDSFEWDKSKSLEAFRTKFGFQGAQIETPRGF